MVPFLHSESPPCELRKQVGTVHDEQQDANKSFDQALATCCPTMLNK
jgi:hypothetical protein